MKITFEEACKIIRANTPNKHYEIVEDNYVYPNGVTVIVYDDPDHEHELWHEDFNLDNWSY